MSVLSRSFRFQIAHFGPSLVTFRSSPLPLYCFLPSHCVNIQKGLAEVSPPGCSNAPSFGNPRHRFVTRPGIPSHGSPLPAWSTLLFAYYMSNNITSLPHSILYFIWRTPTTNPSGLRTHCSTSVSMNLPSFCRPLLWVTPIVFLQRSRFHLFCLLSIGIVLLISRKAVNELFFFCAMLSQWKKNDNYLYRLSTRN